MKIRKKLITAIVFASIISILPISHAFEFSWQLDETPEGQESSTVVQPVKVVILDEQIEIADDSASIRLMQKYSVHLGKEWDAAYAHRLVQIFESITANRKRNKVWKARCANECMDTHR